MDLFSLTINLISFLNLEKYSEKIVSLLDPQKIAILLAFLTVILLFFIIGSYKIFTNTKKIKNCLKSFFENQLFILKKIFKDKIFLILAIPILINFYFIITLPVTYDEAYSFINFFDRGIAVSISYYPASNNHVFYSVLSSILNIFINANSILPFRIISSIFFILSLFMITKIFIINIKNFKNYHYLLISIAPMSFVALYQSSLARGYTLLLFLVLLNIFIIGKILKSQNNYNWILWTIISSLSFYTIPAYVYTHFIFCIIILIYQKNYLFNLIKYNCFVVIITLFLYLPIVAFQGIDFVYGHGLLQKIEYGDFFYYLEHINEVLSNEVLGIQSIIIYFLLLISLILSFKSNKLKVFIILLTIIVIPLFIPFIQKNVPPGRIFTLIYFLFFIMIAISFKVFLQNFTKKQIFIICLTIQLIFFINHNNLVPHEKYSSNAEELSLKILKNNNKYLMCSNLYDVFLVYYKIKHRFKMNKIDLSKEIKCRSEQFQDYNWIVIDKNRDFSNEKPIYTSVLWNFYKTQ